MGVEGRAVHGCGKWPTPPYILARQRCSSGLVRSSLESRQPRDFVTCTSHQVAAALLRENLEVAEVCLEFLKNTAGMSISDFLLCRFPTLCQLLVSAFVPVRAGPRNLLPNIYCDKILPTRWKLPDTTAPARSGCISPPPWLTRLFAAAITFVNINPNIGCMKTSS